VRRAIGVVLAALATQGCVTGCLDIMGNGCGPPTPRLLGLNVDVVDVCGGRRELALIMSDGKRPGDLRVVSSNPALLEVWKYNRCEHPIECFLLTGHRPGGSVELIVTSSALPVEHRHRVKVVEEYDCATGKPRSREDARQLQALPPSGPNPSRDLSP
jgi:hypothetical protein